jgi:predicted NAD/FAD-dependent oxidoreductase
VHAWGADARVSAPAVGRGGAGDGVRPESNTDLANQARDALAAWYPSASLGDFELLRTDRVAFAQFAQPPGVHERLPDARDPDGPVYLAGDYTRDSSINGAVQSGRDAADAVGEDFA